MSWSKAIESATTPRIFPVVDGDTGVMSGNIRPFNEYYIVAYLAMLLQPNEVVTYMHAVGNEFCFGPRIVCVKIDFWIKYERTFL